MAGLAWGVLTLTILLGLPEQAAAVVGRYVDLMASILPAECWR